MWCENLQILTIDNQIFSILFNPYILIFQLSLHFKYRFYSSVLPPGSSSGSPRLPLSQSNASESGSGILAQGTMSPLRICIVPYTELFFCKVHIDK